MQNIQNAQAGLAYRQAGKSYVLVVVVVGVMIALGAFLVAFITTQKAQAPKPYSNLRIPPMKIPTPAPVAPLLNPTPASSQLTPDVSPVNETTPATPLSTFEETGVTTSSPSL